MTRILALLILTGTIHAQDVSKISPNVLSEEQRKEARSMIDRDIRKRRDDANSKNLAEWRKIKTREQWEKYRDERLQRLQTSLGTSLSLPKKVPVHITSTIKGDGFLIKNLVYETRPGQWVTANLYVPATPTKSMPGIIIATSHHRDKWQGENQDMGMTWAHKGCMVLVLDEVGYGERRPHPFHSSKDYDKEYKSWRQDYYHRHDTGIQLQLAGESLMGWFVQDLKRGVDLLCQQPGIDTDRIIILGSVAGGGDPCAVTAALDKRIDGAVPFNFGGAQPETRFPLPKNAEESFNYLGGSYWDSVRGLRRGGADGFFHWLIVGSIAPRSLIYSHEFAWDKERDPVWKRFQVIWGDFYGARDKLGSAAGKGSVKGRPPESTHCTNIGKYHRQFIHPLFKKWYQIDVKPEDEYSKRVENRQLTCWNAETRQKVKPIGFQQQVSTLGATRAALARKELDALKPEARLRKLRKDWRELLGPIDPTQKPKVVQAKSEVNDAGVLVERIVLETEPGIVVPVLLLRMNKVKRGPMPAVIAVAQTGKEALIKNRADEIQKLLREGTVVVLPDVRGTGETKAGTSRGRTSGDGGRSVRMLLFDETVLGQRLRDLRSVIDYVQSRDDVNAKKLALWGDSFANVNTEKTNFKVPRGVSGRPHQSEPLGGLLALLGALYEKDVQAIYVHGGLSSFESVLNHYQVLIPHDVVVPNVLTKGDLADVARALAPRPIRFDGLVDGMNRRLSANTIKTAYDPEGKIETQTFTDGEGNVAGWLLMK